MQPGAVSHIGSQEVPVSLVHTHTKTHTYTHIYTSPRWGWPPAPVPAFPRSQIRWFHKTRDCLSTRESPRRNLEMAVQKQSKRISNGSACARVRCYLNFPTQSHHMARKINHASSRMRKIIWKTGAMAIFCAARKCSALKLIATDVFKPHFHFYSFVCISGLFSITRLYLVLFRCHTLLQLQRICHSHKRLHSKALIKFVNKN